MLGTLALGLAAAVSLLWSLDRFRRRDADVGAGALAAAAVLAGGATVHAVELGPWMEGGVGMLGLTVLGAYAIGAAVAYRRSGSRGARAATLVASVVTLVASGLLYQHALGPVADLVRGAPPAEAELILTAARAEASRLPQLAVALVLFAAVTSLVGRGRRARVRSGEVRTTRGDRVAFASA